MRHAIILRAAAAALLLTTTISAGGADPQTLCQGSKLKAVARGVRGAFSCKPKELAGLTLSTYDAQCIGALSAKFGRSWSRAVQKADRKDVSCLNAPGLEGVLSRMASAASGASAAIRAGFGPGDDANATAVRALNSLMKASEAYLSATLAAHARNTLKPGSAKLAKSLANALQKLGKKFTREAAKAAKKGVTFAGNASAAAAAMDAVVSVLAADVTTNPTFPVGVFVDSAVEGAQYAPGLDGTKSRTLRGGLFAVTGASVAFSIGDVALGSASVPSSGRVTPVSLVAGAVDQTHPTVTNLARFLLTLDDDAKGKNGISIADAVRTAAQGQGLDVTDEAAVVALAEQLSAFTKKGARTAVPAGEAQDHLAQTLIAGFAGKYTGTFTGTDFGTWTLTIAASGKIKGSGFSNDDGKFGIQGNVDSSGAATLASGSTSTGATFSGSIDATGVFSGTWQSGPDSGTFTGQLQS